VEAVEGLRSGDSAQHFIFDNLSKVLPPSGSWRHRHLRPRELCAPIWTSAYGALASLWYRPHNIRSSQKSSRWMTTYHETRHETYPSLTIHNLTYLLFLSFTICAPIIHFGAQERFVWFFTRISGFHFNGSAFGSR